MSAQERSAHFIDTDGTVTQLSPTGADSIRTVIRILARGPGYQSPVEDFILNLVTCYEVFERSDDETWEPEDFRRHVQFQLEQFDENLECLIDDIRILSTRYRSRILKAIKDADQEASPDNPFQTSVESQPTPAEELAQLENAIAEQQPSPTATAKTASSAKARRKAAKGGD